MGNRTNTEMNKKIGEMLQKARMSKRLTRKQRKSRALSEEDKAAIAARLKAARKK